MINFRIYNMNEHELLASNLTREETIQCINSKKNQNRRIMVIKHDTETKGDEIVNIENVNGRIQLKELSCVELKREIVEKRLKK